VFAFLSTVFSKNSQIHNLPALKLVPEATEKNHLCSNQPLWVPMVASDWRTPGASWQHETHFSFCKYTFLTWCL